MKWQARQAKQECYFWSSSEPHEGFSKINDSVKYLIQKWIISHPHVIQSPIVNNYIAVNVYYEIRGVNTELLHTVIIQVYYQLKKDATEFYMSYDDRGIFFISDSAFQFIRPPQLQNMTQRH